MKYVIFKTENPVPRLIPIIFPKELLHKEVAKYFSHLLVKGEFLYQFSILPENAIYLVGRLVVAEVQTRLTFIHNPEIPKLFLCLITHTV